MCVICQMSQGVVPGGYTGLTLPPPEDKGPREGLFGQRSLIDNNPSSDTIPADITTTFSVSVGGSTVGYINSNGDGDAFRVNLVAGQTYQFELNGSGSSPLSDPYLSLFGPSGSFIVADDDGGPGTNSLIGSFTPTTSGTYFLLAEAFSTQVGEYTLSASTVAPPSTPVTNAIDWGGTEVALSSGNTLNVYFARNGETFDGQPARDWTPYEKQQALLALQQYSNVINVNFVEVSSPTGAQFRLVVNNNPLGEQGLAYMYPPDPAFGSNQGIAWFDGSSSIFTTSNLAQGGDAFQTLIHEFGHGLGLAHPHDTGGGSEVLAGVSGPFGSLGLFNLNQNVHTVMSYNRGWSTGPQAGDPDNSVYGGSGTLSPLDIAILQQKYGARTTFNTGNNTYFLPLVNAAGTFYSAIWDAGGTDTISAGSTSLGVTIDLRPATNTYAVGGGGFVSFATNIHGGFTIAQNVVIENAVGGSGGDTLTGNSAANLLYGNGGIDVMNGEGGNDHLYGGIGGDTHNGGEGTDYAHYDDQNYGNLVINLLVPSVNTGAAQNDTYNSIEGIVAGAGNDIIGGNNGANFLLGGIGSDQIYAYSGADYLDGGANNDHLWGGDGGDSHVGGDGIDYARYDDANWGNLVINLAIPSVNTGAAAGDTYTAVEGIIGGAGRDTIGGNQLGNYLLGQGNNDNLYGYNGADYLDGGEGDDNIWGAQGADQHIGGNGIDFARYDDAAWGPLVISLQTPGINTNVAAGDTYTSIEGVYASTVGDVVIGNGVANYLYGLGAADFIDGLLGSDFLYGGTGSDFFQFSTALGASNIDTLADFVVADDTIYLDNAIFTTLGATFDANEFSINTTTATSRIIYNSTTGALTYDADANGGGAAVQFAVLPTGLTTMTSADFLIS